MASKFSYFLKLALAECTNLRFSNTLLNPVLDISIYGEI